MDKKINILHLINSLDPGGAENLLLNQVELFDNSRFNIYLGYLKGSSPQIIKNRNISIVDFSNNGKFSIKCFNNK